MTHEGELVNLAHYRVIRIEAGVAAAEPASSRRNGRNGTAAADTSLPLLVHITATGGKEAGTLRLTGDIPREDAELIMLKVADELRAIGYVEDHDEDEPPAPAPKKPRRMSSPAAASPPAPEEPAAPKPRRGRKPKAVIEAEKAAAAAAAAAAAP